MNKVEMMREALKELGEATPDDLAAFVHTRYGVKVEPRFIPILKASVRDKEMLEDFRQKVKAAAGGTDSPAQAA